jgi:hypothetical protein
MTTLSTVVKQIKHSSEDSDESTSVYLNEIFDAINDGFKSLTESVDIGFSLLDMGMATPLAKLIDETPTDEETPKVFDEINKSIKLLKDGLNDQKISVDINNVSANITDKLKEINNNEGLIAQFKTLQTQLDTSSVDSREIAVQQLEEFESLIEATSQSQTSEEDRRESNTLTARISGSIEGLGNGIKSLGDNLGDVVSSTAKGVGIAGLALLFLNPEKAMDLLSGAIEIFTDGLTAITDLLTGSTDGLFDFIKNNPITSIVIGIAAIVKIVSIVGSIIAGLTTAFGGIVAAIGTIVSSVASIGGIIGTISTTLGIGIAPLIGIGVAIGVAIYSLIDAFTSALDVFKDTGSIGETLKDFFSGFIGNFVGIILDIPKALISWIAGALGFEQFETLLDSFSFVDIIKTTVGNVIDVISGAIGAFLTPFKILGEMLGNVFGGLVDVFGGLIDIIKGVFTFDLDLIESGLSSIFGGIVDIILSPFKAIGDLMTDAFDMLKAAFDGIKNLVLNPIDTVLGFFGIGAPDEDEKDLARKEELLKNETNPLKQKRLKDDIDELKQSKAADEKEAKEARVVKEKEKAKDNFFDNGGLFSDASIDRSSVSKVSTSDLKEILTNADTLNGEDYKFIQETILAREAAVVSKPDIAPKEDNLSRIEKTVATTNQDAMSSRITPAQSNETNSFYNSNMLSSLVEDSKIITARDNSTTATASQDNTIQSVTSNNTENDLDSIISNMFAMSKLPSTSISESFSTMATSNDNDSALNLEVNRPVTELRNAQLEYNQLQSMDKDSGSKAVVSAINNSTSSNSSNSTTIINNNNKGIDDLIRGMAYTPV